MLGAAVNIFPKKAHANPLDDLFKEALKYIADIIIKYYGQRWYENTKEQIGDWGEFNQDKTVEEENTLRIDYARLGDAINATEKELANRELMADTEPTPLNCVGGEATALKQASKESVVKEKVTRSNNRNPNVKTSGNNSPIDIDDYDTGLHTDDGEELSEKIGSACEYLMNGIGYTQDELETINGFMSANLPVMPQINLIGEGARADRKNAKRATRIAQINTIKSALDHLLAKRTKHQTSGLDARLEDLAKHYYRDGNSAYGLSDAEILQINVDLYTKNKELNNKVNGESGFVSYVPVGILLSEMKSVENKLLAEINEIDQELNKLMAIQSLLSVEAD
ncbi:hypothetical protein [Shewanella aestuarii]|uniref:Uncharacterized protein n=1 Tax=Shewanella aestuarii TaxID=1028752 RepID=A0A6G9QPI8_9GAMM|nr:hypothetical protein [Shewanella aestuarii]QIR16504.1 hypothetical protein HBH39_18685 [Shewanella aestuarii]